MWGWGEGGKRRLRAFHLMWVVVVMVGSVGEPQETGRASIWADFQEAQTPRGEG